MNKIQEDVNTFMRNYGVCKWIPRGKCNHKIVKFNKHERKIVMTLGEKDGL